MPAGWISAAAAVYGAVSSANASSNAADAQTNAANQSNATQLQIYNQQRQDQQPWRQAGGQALNALSQYYGLGGLGGQTAQVGAQANQYGGPGSQYGDGRGGPAGHGLMQTSGQQGGVASPAQGQQPYNFNQILQNLPGYQFQRDQGNEAVQRNLAARGLLGSGAGAKALDQYGQGLASNYAQQYTAGLQSLAGLGQSSANATGQAGQNYANQASSAYGYAGNAQAAGAIGQGQAWANGLGGIAQAYGQYQAGQQGYQQAQNFAASNPIAPAPTYQDPNWSNAGLSQYGSP